MKLVPLMTYYARLAAARPVGAGTFGTRLIVEVDGGEFEGPRLKGVLHKAGCADWATMTAEYGHLDVRATLETDDGAFIYMEYFGKLELTPAIQAAMAGNGSTEYGDAYFFNAPRLQTGDPRYAWVNNIVCLGQGRISGGCVHYQVFQATND